MTTFRFASFVFAGILLVCGCVGPVVAHHVMDSAEEEVTGMVGHSHANVPNLDGALPWEGPTGIDGYHQACLEYDGQDVNGWFTHVTFQLNFDGSGVDLKDDLVLDANPNNTSPSVNWHTQGVGVLDGTEYAPNTVAAWTSIEIFGDPLSEIDLHGIWADPI